MTKTISVRLDEKLVDAVDAAGESSQLGRSDVVREALQLWLRQRRIANKVRRHRDGYARQPVKPDEFPPVLGAQRWPK
ncbi:MAG TPA: ribbon-helix-helix domain-containing protein [Candidatus Binatia bacterium]